MKIPDVFTKDSEERLEKLLQRKPKKKELTEKPRIGDYVYVQIGYYKDSQEKDCLVSIGRISHVKQTKALGKKKYRISIEDNQPCVWYDWDFLKEYQEAWALNYEALKRKYTEKLKPFHEFNC